MPMPTNPPCMGSCPDPPPEISPTFPWTVASARTTTCGSNCTLTRSGWAASTPRSSSRTTSSALLMSFFMFLLSPPNFSEPLRPELPLPAHVRRPGICAGGAEEPADDGTDHRDPAVAPVRVALAGDRQDEVHDARTEVSSRVDGVPRGAAERHADHDHEQRDPERTDLRSAGERDDAEHQHERADDLGD